MNPWLPPCEREPGWFDDLGGWSRGAAELGVGRPLVSGVVCDRRLGCGPGRREAGARSHGYDLCRSLDLKPGTVYPILIRLAECGLLVTSWEGGPPKERPARHRYRISPDDAEYAASCGWRPRRVRLSVAPPPTLGIAGAAAGGAIAGVVL